MYMCTYICMYTYTYYICMYIYGLRSAEWIWFYGWLLSPSAPSPSCTRARIQLRASRSPRTYTYTPAASSRASSPVQPGVPNTNTNGVGPIHQGTKPRAINLFARQPATRHCVYPHVNHYVRPRDVESAPLRTERARSVSPRISNSSFPVVARRNAVRANRPRDANISDIRTIIWETSRGIRVP